MKLYVLGEWSGNPEEWEGISWNVQERMLVLAESPEQALEFAKDYGGIGVPIEVSFDHPCVLTYECLNEAAYGDDL